MSTRLVPLSAVAEINPSTAKGVRERASERVTFLPMSSVSEDATVSYHEERQIADVLKGYTYFERGDVLLAKITPCMENGKAALLDTMPTSVGFGSTEFHVLRPGPEIDARYLFYGVWNARFRFVAERNMTGTAGQKRVPTSFLRAQRIPLPPLAEQRRIAAMLDKADAVRRKRREAVGLLDEFLRSVFLEMFGDPVRNEKGWEVRTLRELVDPDRPITYGILKPGPDQPDGIPYVRVVDMVEGTVRDAVRRTTRKIAEAYKRSMLRAGDVLLSIRGHVGRIAVTPKELEGGNITQDTARLAIIGTHMAPYMQMCLASEPMQQLMQRFVKGVAVRGINLGDVKELPVPVPPLNLREVFTKVLERHGKLWHEAVEAQDHHNDLFNSLAQRAFRSLQ